MTDKDFKIEFAPGCFDEFEGSQEELDQLVKDILDIVSEGSMVDNPNVLTVEDLDDLPDDLREFILRDLEMIEDIDSCVEDRKRKLN
jgi:hypothetical protein